MWDFVVFSYISLSQSLPHLKLIRYVANGFCHSSLSMYKATLAILCNGCQWPCLASVKYFIKMSLVLHRSYSIYLLIHLCVFLLILGRLFCRMYVIGILEKRQYFIA